MPAIKERRVIEKEHMTHRVNSSASPVKKYQEMIVGSKGWASLLHYELTSMFVTPMPGALGMVLRKSAYPTLLGKVGHGSNFGRNIALRHPKKIAVGAGVVIDENCLLDGTHEIEIGDRVFIGRGAFIQAKNAEITIGDDCILSSQTRLGSVGGIHLGNNVMVAGQAYIGGGRYRTDDVNVPIRDQALYTNGPVEIGDDVWIGAGAIIIDGVRIGRGSVIGAGAIVQEDVPDFTIVVPRQRSVMLPRDKA